MEHKIVPAEQQMVPAEQQMVPAPPEWSTDQGPWLLLVCIPHVIPSKDFPPGTDLSLLREYAPHDSRLTVSRRIAPDPKDIYNHPYVAAVGGFGRFLLHATRGTQPDRQAAVDDFDTNAEARHLGYEGFPRAYFLCDIATGKATRLPDPERPILNHGNVGLVTTSSESIVVELQPWVGTNRATLLCYFASSGAWAVHSLCYPSLTAHLPKWKGGDGVINFMDRLIWVDLAIGIVSLAIPLLSSRRRPKLHYTPLPQDSQITAYTRHEQRRCTSGHAQRRCIGVSQGKLRFVEIPYTDETIRLWTLLNLETTAEWRLDSEISIQQLWEDEGFRAMNLPEETPAVAFVHPEHSSIVYFLLNYHLFSVDMITGRFLGGHLFNMIHPPADYHSSRFVRPWRLTPELFHHGTGMCYYARTQDFA
jgi:hypothetical protein